VLCFARAVLALPFKSKLRLEAENAVLRHQLIDLRRRVRGRAQPTNNDRWFLVQMYRWFPSILKVVTIVQPETLVLWHRAGFRCYNGVRTHRSLKKDAPVSRPGSAIRRHKFTRPLRRTNFKAFDFCLHQVHHGQTGSRLALHERRSVVERVARGLCPLPRVLCFLLIMSPTEHSPLALPIS